jgi:O-antigen/teichoic acid export membrane protein
VRLLRTPRISEFAILVGFNGLAQFAPLVAALLLTPLLLDRLGLDRFGLWSLALVILSTFSVLDGGISTSLARFFAIHGARNDRSTTGRLLLGAIIVFGAAGSALTLAAVFLAPVVLQLVDLPVELHDEGLLVIRWLPPIGILALVADSAVALLKGNGRFGAFAGAMYLSSGTFAAAVIVLVQPGAGLAPLLAAAALRYAVLAAAGMILAARHVSFRRPLLPSRAMAREFIHYASRMQLSALTGFVNSEMGALVIAGLLPIRYVGLYSIALQASAAARSFPLYVLAPVLTRMTRLFRSRGRSATVAEFVRFERRWLPMVLGYGVVSVAAVVFAIPLWLGEPYAVSGVLAMILLSGYVVHVAFTGMRTCFVRAVGRPGLETRYSIVWTFCSVALTIPLALAAGAIGVAIATAASAAIASGYFPLLCRRAEELPVLVPARSWLAAAAVAALITVLGELALLESGVRGFSALALAALPALAALAVFAAAFRRAPAAGLAG